MYIGNAERTTRRFAPMRDFLLPELAIWRCLESFAPLYFSSTDVSLGVLLAQEDEGGQERPLYDLSVGVGACRTTLFKSRKKPAWRRYLQPINFVKLC